MNDQINKWVGWLRNQTDMRIAIFLILGISIGLIIVPVYVYFHAPRELVFKKDGCAERILGVWHFYDSCSAPTLIKSQRGLAKEIPCSKENP